MFRTIVLFLLFSFVILFDEKLIYQCNFDQSTPTDHCFYEEILILSAWFNIDENPPVAPLSDVTAISEPTNDTSICDLPFRWQNKSWDSFFCVRKFCSTKRNNSALCQTGKFGLTQVFTTTTHRFTLKLNNSIESNENDEFLLIFFYFMSIDGDKSIEIRKKESNQDEEILSIIRSSPFNGWIEHRITFSINYFPFQIFFDLQKATLDSSSPYFAFDQLSLIQIHRPETTTRKEIDVVSSEFISSLNDVSTSSSSITSTEETTQISSTQIETTTTVKSTEVRFSSFNSISTIATSSSSRPITTIAESTKIESTTIETSSSSLPTTTTTGEIESTRLEMSSSSLLTTIVESTKIDSTSTKTIEPTKITSTTSRSSSIFSTTMKNSTNENATEKPNETNPLLIILLSVFIPLGLIIGISLITFYRLRRISKKRTDRSSQPNLYELNQTSSF